MNYDTISEEQVLHNELSFEINQELIHLMKRIIEIQRVNQQLKGKWNELKEWLEENESLDDYCNETTFTSVLDKMEELEKESDAK